MSDSGGVTTPSSTFLCATCGRVAATVTLLHRGEPDPTLADQPLAPGRSEVMTDFDRLSIVGGPASYTIGTGMNVATVEKALAGSDARLLYELDFEFAPFWCPTCDASYCDAHYVSWTVYDEGFFDCVRGRCPRGHERMLVD